VIELAFAGLRAVDVTERGPENTARTVLPNRVRVCTQYVPGAESVSLGIWVAVGSRHESDGWHGASHFLEHMLFKGTESRSAREIAEAMDKVGGQLNGFTDREFTCFYAWLRAAHVALGADLLCDMLTRPRFDPVELERERQVVLEEIAHEPDVPEDWVHELFAQAIWRGHPLGYPLIGDAESVAALTTDRLREYKASNYAASKVVAAAAGKVDHHALLDLMAPALGELSAGSDDVPEPELPAPHAGLAVNRPTEQMHFCMGVRACSQTDERRHAQVLLDAAVGGGSSSRLFQEIRENRGLVYHIGSDSVAYRASGTFLVSASTSPERFDLVVDLVRKEIERVRVGGVEEEEVARAKEQVKGAMALGLENTYFRMRRLAMCEIYWGRFLPFAEIAASIDAVTTDQVNALARELLAPEDFVLTSVGPLPGRGAGRGEQS
jgi:predicted Zn-dependent peptidase